MSQTEHRYARPIEIAENIHWVGFYEPASNFHCNPYLVVENDRAVLIDGGSRPDFAAVMLKILQTGVSPSQISALIYQHYDPDLCGSMSNLVDICSNPDLQIISARENHSFIGFYLESNHRSLLRSTEEYGHAFPLGARTLQFFYTPYAHARGSFMTYDVRTKTLFTSDLFGSMSENWELFLQLSEACYACRDVEACPQGRDDCPIGDIVRFHRAVMPSRKALAHAMDIVASLDVLVIAPQHGSIIRTEREIDYLVDVLKGLDGVGIDGIDCDFRTSFGN